MLLYPNIHSLVLIQETLLRLCPSLLEQLCPFSLFVVRPLSPSRDPKDQLEVTQRSLGSPLVQHP